MSRIILVRHARTAWNVIGKAQGHVDIPLDEVGEAQAKALGQRFATIQVERIVSSDLRRCLQTAEAIGQARGITPEADPRLRERSFGEWEGSLYDEVRERIAQDPAGREHARPPGGESMADVWERTAPFIQELLGRSEDTVVVTHGGTKSILLAQLVRGTLETPKAFRFLNTAVTVLERRPAGTCGLLYYGDASHLQDLLDEGPTEAKRPAEGVVG